MSRLALTGGAYEARSLIASAQRAVNLVAEPLPEAQGEPSRAFHVPTPGLRLLSSIGPGPIRGIRQATTGGIYVVSGSTVYSVNASTWAGTSLGSITPGLRTPVSMADNGLELVIVDGTSGGWKVGLAGNTFAVMSDPTGAFVGADRVDYLDLFFLFNSPRTPIFYWSVPNSTDFSVVDPGDPTSGALDYGSKTIYGDLLVTLAVAKREIYLLGERTTEIWYDTGASDTASGQFSPVQGVFIDHGIVAKYSVANYDNGLFWLSRDRQGQGIVLEAADYKTKRVSTYAIEVEISGYARIDDAVGYCYQLGGHAFYVLTFPHADHTWVYDITTGLWHEWLWIDSNGAEHRHRSNCHAAISGLNVVGDWQNGNVYALDNRVFTDNGHPIKRVRSFPHILADGRRVFYRDFVADFETGTAPQRASAAVPPVEPEPVAKQIAQLMVPADGGGNPSIAVPDWLHGRIYFGSSSALRSYSAEPETQTPIASSLAYTSYLVTMDADPVTGALIAQRPNEGGGISNYMPLWRYDPDSFAVTATIGLTGSFASYPTAFGLVEWIICAGCGTVASGGSSQVGFAFLKENVSSGVVSVVRTDGALAHAGFSQDVVSGTTLNRAIGCRGKSGPDGASVFITWSGNVNAPAATLPLYAVEISPGAETYNPATWPATNPHITHRVVGTILAASIDPAWTLLSCEALTYDRTDGNVLLFLTTNEAVANTRYLAKVRATDAAVMWATAAPLSLAVNPYLAMSNVTRQVVGLISETSYSTVDTATGASTPSAPLGGLFFNVYPGSGGWGGSTSDDTSSLYFAAVTFNGAAANAPAPAPGTPASFTGYALISGLIPPPPPAPLPPPVTDDDLISLESSDDRGHSWGSPVSQPIGRAGEYRKSLQWRRLGMARDRCFRLSWSSPLATALQGAWIDAEPGDGGQEKK